MELQEFCKKLSNLPLYLAQKAITILWFHDSQTPGIQITGTKLASLLREYGIGNPNITTLKENIKKTGLVFSKGDSFQLKEAKKAEVRKWVESILLGYPTEIEISSQYLPESIWKSTRGYIENVCKQVNGCFFHGYYDGTAVLIRRLFETLIIESYEFKKRANEIKDADGHYFMLGELINKILNPNGIHIGRDAGKALKNIKALGDRSAHNRHFNAKKNDLEKIQEDVRLTSQVLLSVANIAPK